MFFCLEILCEKQGQGRAAFRGETGKCYLMLLKGVENRFQLLFRDVDGGYKNILP